MGDIAIKNSRRDFKIVKKRIIKKLLELEQGRFPSKRINNFNDIMVSKHNN